MDKSSSNQSRWLNVDKAAAYLSCSRNFLDKDRIQKLHGIPFSRLGRKILYDREELDKFLKKTEASNQKANYEIAESNRD